MGKLMGKKYLKTLAKFAIGISTVFVLCVLYYIIHKFFSLDLHAKTVRTILTMGMVICDFFLFKRIDKN